MKLIKSDIEVYYVHRNKVRNKLLDFLSLLFVVDFKVVLRVRIYQYLYSIGYCKFAIFLQQRLKRKYAVDIAVSCKIKAGFRLTHAFNIVIGENVIIGKGVKIFNGVNLGKKYPTVLDGEMPEIGNYCIIGTGSKILGDILVPPFHIVGANIVLVNEPGLKQKGVAVLKDSDYISTLMAILN